LRTKATDNVETWTPWKRVSGNLAYTTSQRNAMSNLGISLGDTMLDVSLYKPLWVKATGVKEINTLTINSVATAGGNISVTLNGVLVAITGITTSDTTTTIADKIRAKLFYNWIVSGTGATVIFTKAMSGINSAPSFGSGSTSVGATFVRTTIGTIPTWIDAMGTVV